MDGRRLAAVDDVPTDGTLVFTIERDGSTREVVVSRLDDGAVVAWENHCQHWIDVRLDKGDGAVLRGNEIVCQNHGAMFDRETGRCTWGPCEGARLDPVDIEHVDGTVLLDEPGWTVMGRGIDEAAGHGSRGGLDL